MGEGQSDAGDGLGGAVHDDSSAASVVKRQTRYSSADLATESAEHNKTASGGGAVQRLVCDGKPDRKQSEQIL